MYWKVWSTLLAVFLSPALVIGQTQDDEIADSLYIPIESLKNNDFHRFIDASVHTLVSPVKWNRKDYLALSGIVAGTALVSLADEPVRSFWLNQSSTLEPFERVGYHYGKAYAAVAITGGFYLTGLAIKNEWARETGLILGSAYLSSGVFSTVLKSVIGRARPFLDEGPVHFTPFTTNADYHSIPSGHTQIGLISAIVLANRVKNPVLKTLFYTAAGITLASRMYADAHWISDVAASTAIAMFTSKAVLRRMEQNNFGKGNGFPVSWQVTPAFNKVSLSLKF